MGLSSSKNKLGDRQPEFPLALENAAEIWALQAVPSRHVAIIEPSGRVIQQDFDKSVIGWVDANGVAFRNDYPMTKVGWIDLATNSIYQNDYNNTLVGRVDEDGNIFAGKTVVHELLTTTAIGKISGPKASYPFAGCAFMLLC